ncbi:MAG: hypothetical protein OXT65_06420 [Alphaproteobacteria bacterium]|nr:hypothetical protein [Alphaproteobacteria bacterium]
MEAKQERTKVFATNFTPAGVRLAAERETGCLQCIQRRKPGSGMGGTP